MQRIQNEQHERAESSESVGAPISSEQLSQLKNRCVDQLAQGWHRGEQPSAEDLLARHPQLLNKPEAAFRIIYEEICQRQDQGQEQPPQYWVEHFPHWRRELEVLLECHGLVHAQDETCRFPEPGES